MAHRRPDWRVTGNATDVCQIVGMIEEMPAKFIKNAGKLNQQHLRLSANILTFMKPRITFCTKST